MNDVLHTIMKEDLRDAEKVLWAEEIDLRPFLRRRWLWNFVAIMGANLSIAFLYFTQIGDLSLKTILILAAGLNSGTIGLFLVELFSDFKNRNSRVGHLITNFRVMTTAWNDEGVHSNVYTNIDQINRFAIKKEKHLHLISFYSSTNEVEESVKFRIHTAHPVAKIKPIISSVILEEQPHE